MKIALIKAAPLAAVMAFAAAPAQAVDFTFCTVDGTPYCDGVSLDTSTIGSRKTVSGAHTGACAGGGTAFGSFVYGLANLGPTAAIAFGGTSIYSNGGSDLHGEVLFVSPFPWRLTGDLGNVVNTGNMCLGAPAVTATSAASAGGI